MVKVAFGNRTRWFGAESFNLADFNFISQEDISFEKHISLREAVCFETGVQSMSKCACKPRNQSTVYEP